MSQYTINIGTLPNDGTGDPLRTAFNETNLNFDQVFAAGPVLSNIRIANNTILTTNTNGNLILNPNGIGVVQANAHVVPDSTRIRNLGSANLRWNTVYTQYATVYSDLSVGGNLSVVGNVIQIGNIVTDSLTIQLANTASTPTSANGAGITVGANDNIATILYNSTGNVWTTNIGISAVGNISAPYFIGNGSQLTGLPASYSNANVATFLANFGSNTISTTGNITGNYIFGNGSQLTGINVATSSISNGTSNVNIATANSDVTITTAGANTWTFNTQGDLYFPGNTIAGDNIEGTGNFGFETPANTGFGILTNLGAQEWSFGSNGTLTLPGTGSIDNQANTSLDPLTPTASTMVLTPDGNYNLQALVLDPTAPGHIHLRSLPIGMGNIDQPYANIFLGGELSSFEVGASYGSEIPSVFVHSNGNTWTFGTDGDLTLPGDVNSTPVAGDGFPFDTTITGVTTGNPTVVVTFSTGIFGAPVQGKVTIYGVLGTDQVNDTWWYVATETNEITLYTDDTFSTPVNGTTWTAYISGGQAVSVIYNDLNISGGTVFVGNPNRFWQFASSGEVVAPPTATIFGQSSLTLEATETNKLTNVINNPIIQEFTEEWATATYSDFGGNGRIEIVGSTANLRRFVQLYMDVANPGTAQIIVNNELPILNYTGFDYDLTTFTIYVTQSPGDSVTVTTMTMNAVVKNILELDSDNNSLNIQSLSGWPVRIQSGYQGDVFVDAGDDIFIRAGDKTTPDNTGGQIDLDAGTGGSADAYDSAGSGGGINIRGGDGGSASNAWGAGNGGTTYITGGQGGSANGPGLQQAGNGGSLQLYAGSAGSNDGNVSLGRPGGDVNIQAGYSTGNAVGGAVYITAGTGGTDYGSGNIVLQTQTADHLTDYIWQYNNDGSTIYPTLATARGDTTSGTITGSTIKIGDGSQEAVITTPDGDANTVSDSQRIVINPGKGQDGTSGEGGDIYLWAGRGGSGDAGNAITAGSGGDIKIRGGQGGGTDGAGGYIRMEAGDSASVSGQAGYIEITGGYGAGGSGGYVRILGGYGNFAGGDANLTGGTGSVIGGVVNITGGVSANSLAEHGNVNINTGASTWTFDNTGKLKTGGNLLLAPDANNDGGYLDIYLTAGPDIHIATNSENLILGRDSGANITVGVDGNVKVRADSGTAQNWTFGNDGSLTLPATNISAPAGEAAQFIGTRKIIGGITQTNPYSVALAAGGTPTVAYTASSSTVNSVKVTFAVQSSGGGFQWEQFDVVAAVSQDVGGAVNYVVSNRVKGAAGIADTAVTATINGSGQIEISLNLAAAQTSGGTSSFDAVEFGLMID